MNKAGAKVLKYFVIAVVALVAIFTLIIYTQELRVRNFTDEFYLGKYKNLILIYLKNSTKEIEHITKDWAMWDDAYNFMKTGNHSFIKDNFPGNTLPNLGIDYMLFYTKKGFFFGVTGKDVRMKTNPLGFIPVAPKSGFLKLHNRVYIYCAQNILHSDGKGKSAGILVVLKKLSLSPLKYVIESISLTGVPQTLKEHSSSPSGFIFKNIGKREYIIIKDIFGRPVASISFSLEPQIIQALHRFILFNVISIAALFIILSGLILYLIVKSIMLTKMQKLSDLLRSLPTRSDLIEHIKCSEEEFQVILKTVEELLKRTKESEETLEKVTDIIPAGIIIWGDVIVYANRYARRLLGKGIIGKKLSDVFKEHEELIANAPSNDTDTDKRIVWAKKQTHVFYAVTGKIKYKNRQLNISALMDLTKILKLQKRYRNIVENLPYGVIHKTIWVEDIRISNEKIHHISPDLSKITGYPLDSIALIKKWNKHIVDDVPDRITKLREKGICSCEYKFRKKDGTVIWIKETTLLTSKIKENVLEILMVFEEITSSKKISMFFKTLYTVNKLRAQMNEEGDFLSSVCKTLATTCAFQKVWISRPKGKGNEKEEETLYSYSSYDFGGEFSWKNIYSTTVPIVIDGKVEYYLNVFSDIFNIFDEEFLGLMKQLGTDIGESVSRIRKQKALMYEFYHDTLTGLLNLTALKRNIAKCNECSLIYIRIANLSTLNQIYGMNFCDALLKEISVTLRKISKEKGFTPYKLPGNRFALFKSGLSENRELYRTALIVMERLSSVVVKEIPVALQLNTGISKYPHLATSKDNFIASAEAALLKSTETGKIEFYSDIIRKNIEKHFEIEKCIKESLEKKLFHLRYQPILNLKTRKIEKCEVLTRPVCEFVGDFSIETFFSIAEKTGIIPQITETVLQLAAKEAEKLKDMEIAINISPQDIGNKELMNLLSRLSDNVNIAIEITERDAVENLEELIDFSKMLHSFGIKLEIDDFGAGYSSLKRLSMIDFDILKIDKSLVDMIGDRRSNSIIKHIIDLTHTLGAEVVAEGVERKEQMEFLEEYSCDYIQGFYISRSLSIEQLGKFVQQYNLEREKRD